jgi:cytochrome P450
VLIDTVRALPYGRGMSTWVSELDIPDLTWLDDPAIATEHAREAAGDAARESWIARNLFGYSILHYDDVVAMLRDQRWHSASGQLLELSGIDNPEWLARRRTSILSAEGDEHIRLRRLVGPAFSPRHADALRPYMRAVVDELLDAFTDTGEADIAVDFCEPYPIPIICELFGAPKEDWKLFSAWATDIFRIFNGNLHEDMPTIIRAQDELDEYVSELVEQRRSSPRDDLISALIAAEEQSDRLSHDELLMMCEAVLMAGTDTTRNQLGCSISLFAAHPEQWQLLRERPELVGRAVEETMRFFGTVRGTGRLASDDIEYRGVRFPKGTFIAPSLAQANHDPTVFADPGTFDITRDPPDKPQLTFGSGIHHCLGAALARAEQQEALTIMARRLPGLELAGEIRWKPSTVAIFGPERLPVRFSPTT